MSDGIYIALSGAVGQEIALEATAQNLASASQPGFQRVRAVFSEVLAGQSRYTQVGTAIDTTPGAAASTGRELDAVLPEGHYLAVTTPRGERYMRAVHLDIGAGGVVSAHGQPVASGTGQPIKASPTGGPVAITPDGDITQDGSAIGKLKIVTFTQPSFLSREGGSLLAATPTSGAATTAAPTLQVGALEQGNTQTVSAMTELVSASRAFEAFQRALDAFRDADRKIVTTVPGT